MIRLTPGSRVVLLAELRRRLERLLELDPELVRDGLRDPVHLAVASGPSTRPTSRIAARASIVPKVMIWATWSWPYLRET